MRGNPANAICSSPVAAPGGVWRIQCIFVVVVVVFCFLRVAVLLNRPSDHFKEDFVVVVVEKFIKQLRILFLKNKQQQKTGGSGWCGELQLIRYYRDCDTHSFSSSYLSTSRS